MDKRIQNVLRYLGPAAKTDVPDEMTSMIQNGFAKLEKIARPQSISRIFALSFAEDWVCLEGTSLTLPGKDIRRYLRGCSHAALLAVTLGSPVDALIRAAEWEDMARAVILDACASQLAEEQMETLCRLLSHQLPEGQAPLKAHFSPGYGDLSLDIQSMFLKILDTPRRIGLSCTRNFLLIPRKSITAVCGIETLEPV